MATDAERNRGAGAYSTPGVDTKSNLTPSPIITSAPLVSFASQALQPPSQVYITRDSGLLVVLWNSVPFAGCDVNIQILRVDGQIVVNHYNVVPASNRSRSVFLFNLTEGFLLSVQLFNGFGTVIRGQMFAQVGLVRPVSLNGIQYEMLISDYPTNGAAIGWPGGILRASTEGPGAIRSIVGTAPAAGAEVNEVVPTNARWQIRSFRPTLTTSAAAANREVSIQLTDGVNNYARIPSAFTQLASLSHSYTFGAGLTQYAGAQILEHVAPLPDARLLAGFHITTNTQNLQAGDQYATPIYEVEEWIET